MKKNGFIATSLIYSFFLIFCALLLGYISIYLHNKTLLLNITDNIKEELQEKNSATLISKVSVGSYVYIPLYKNNYNIESVKWIVYKINTSTNTIYLMSDSVLFATTNYTNTVNYQTELNTVLGLYNDGITYINNSDIDSVSSNSTLTQTIKNRLLNVTPAYLFLNSSTPYVYNYTATTPKQVVSITTPVTAKPTRAIVTLNGLDVINSGNGTLNEPYTLNYPSTSNLKLYYDARNSTGYGALSTSALNDLTAQNGSASNAVVNYTSDYIDVSSRSISTYFTLQDFLNTAYTIEFNCLSNYTLTLDFNGNTIVYVNGQISINGTYSGVFISNYSTSNYVDISLVKNGSSTYIYYNGTYVTSVSRVLSYSSTNLLTVTGGANQRLKGLLIYSKSLTSAEVQNNYKTWQEVT